MSAYHAYQTEYNDRECLVQALEVQGYKPQVFDIPTHLTGYHGDKRKELAEVIIPRSQITLMSNDIGFAKNANGSYSAIVSEYDKGTTKGKAIMNDLKKIYAEKKAMKCARQGGLRFVKRCEIATATGTKVQLVFNK